MKLSYLKENKYKTLIAFALITSTSGIWYRQSLQVDKSIENYITQITCIYELAPAMINQSSPSTELDKLDMGTINKCYSEIKKNIELYGNIKGDDQKIEFLTNICVTGAYPVTSEALTAQCRKSAWENLYKN